MRNRTILIAALIIISGLVNLATAQNDIFRRAQGMGRGGGGGGKTDSFAHRTGLEDSITIRFRYLDSSRMRAFDSSLSDFTKKWPVPWDHVTLGNFGTASRSLLFSPRMETGWDHGFHAFDIYNYTLAETKFYNTTRPFSGADYMLGSKGEQLIVLSHTQNIRPNWNAGFQYRLINSPGYFQNQNTNHNNYRLHSWYQSKNKRYQNFVIVVGNKLQAGENGGIKGGRSYLDSSSFSERANIPTELGIDQPGNRNFFQTNISTGTFYTNASYMMRQQYDIGQKDSIVVNDSTVVPLFYPRLRLEHTITYSTYKYRFQDKNADSAYYWDNYNMKLGQRPDTFYVKDFWKVLVNDFSIYQFPDAKNAAQFIKVGASYENISGSFDSLYTQFRSKTDYNFLVHGEYRNKTRNQKWDLEAFGNFYVSGFNAGNYAAFISLKRYLSERLGYLQLGFHNVNRTPSLIFDPVSMFYRGDRQNPITFNKENLTRIFGSLDVPRYKLRVGANYYLITNMAYFKEKYKPDQSSAAFNVLQLTAEKQIRLYKNWNWKTWIVLQQRAGNGPANMPLLTTRNQVGYDGDLGFKNLNISFGLEFRYFTEYKAAGYSPLQGQYWYQDTGKVSLEMPDITAYLHFRIKTFSAYIRAENLNTFNPSGGGFTNNNVPTYNYPYPGLQIRVGIFWSFVN